MWVPSGLQRVAGRTNEPLTRRMEWKAGLANLQLLTFHLGIVTRGLGTPSSPQAPVPFILKHKLLLRGLSKTEMGKAPGCL